MYCLNDIEILFSYKLCFKNSYNKNSILDFIVLLSLFLLS